MGDYLQKVSPGQPMRIPAETYNRLMDMLRWWLGDSVSGGGGDGPGGRPATILVRNDTGVDQDQFDVLGLNGLIFAPGDNVDEFRRRLRKPTPRPRGTSRTRPDSRPEVGFLN